MRRIAIVGGGIAGLTAAYELACLAGKGVPVQAVVYESSHRFGGIIETVREGGFTVEAGPDAWVTAKPWASELAIELGLAGEIIPSNDATRKTWILLRTPQDPSGRLVAMPDRMNMMVPTDLAALTAGASAASLFTADAIAAYRAEPGRAAELRASIPAQDESIAAFVLRHFGPEVLERVATPLLSGVFGGDVHRLSVRAVMPGFVKMEREHGSLVLALQSAAQSALQSASSQPATNHAQTASPIFTSLRGGMGTLVDRVVAAIPEDWLRLHTAVSSIQPPAFGRPRWTVSTSTTGRRAAEEHFDAVLLATPVDAARKLLAPLDPAAANLLPVESSSAVLAAFCFADAARVPIPPGFGFLVPPVADRVPHCEHMGRTDAVDSAASRSLAAPAEQPPRFAFDPAKADNLPPTSLLLACTFADQKFSHRVPPGGRLLRAYFGGAAADRLARCNNDEIAAIARLELARILNRYPHEHAPLSGHALTPLPPSVLTVIRRLPHSLPQYAVGHLDRAAELELRLQRLPGLTLLGNALHGVGVPDLIRDARRAAREAANLPAL
jgi:oxygen-dependent protoporphyrinogen oxidase